MDIIKDCEWDLKMSKCKKYIILYSAFIIYSLSTVSSKLAAGYPVFSLKFLLFYGFMLLFLGIYAVVWQQVLKQFDLGIAYANKAVVVVMGIIWGRLLFGEFITLNKIVGACFIICGVYLVVWVDE